MPDGLAIDHERQIKDTMPPYAQHVVIRTGRDDWSSRIEDEPSTLGTQAQGGLGGTNLARTLKGLMGKGGKFHDSSHPVLITNSSGPRNSKDPGPNRHILQIFPQNLHFPQLPDEPEVIEDFAWRFLSAERRKYFPGRKGSRSTRKGRELAEKEKASKEPVLWNRIVAPTVLICGHMSRDSRCGILGPILRMELKRQIWRTLKNSMVYPFSHSRVDNQAPLHPLHYTTTTLCSHVGGHGFAGNVIIYFPVDSKLGEGQVPSPLAGKSVWYGRVEPRHIEGIVKETLMGGKVIEELLRGVNAFPGFNPLAGRGMQCIENARGRYTVSL